MQKVVLKICGCRLSFSVNRLSFYWKLYISVFHRWFYVLLWRKALQFDRKYSVLLSSFLCRVSNRVTVMISLILSVHLQRQKNWTIKKKQKCKFATVQLPPVRQLNRHLNVVLTIPMQFLRMLQMLKSFLENIGAGKLALKKFACIITSPP